MENKNVIVTGDLPSALAGLNIPGEELKKAGLDFIRKKNAAGSLYFITNLGDRFFEDSISLSAAHEYLTVIDPQTGKQGRLESTGGLYLRIPPGKSFFIQTSGKKPVENRWHTCQAYDTLLLQPEWTVRFESRFGQEIPIEKKTDSLYSWTDWDEELLKTFTGKAGYFATFHLDNSGANARCFRLQIDEVRETAEVIINGIPCGTIWAYPNQLEIPPHILKEENQIEIRVKNTSANYLRWWDEKHPEWKKFYDINFVDITYRPFRPSEWKDEPAGLIGKVYLIKER